MRHITHIPPSYGTRYYWYTQQLRYTWYCELWFQQMMQLLSLNKNVGSSHQPHSCLYMCYCWECCPKQFVSAPIYSSTAALYNYQSRTDQQKTETKCMHCCTQTGCSPNQEAVLKVLAWVSIAAVQVTDDQDSYKMHWICIKSLWIFSSKSLWIKCDKMWQRTRKK